MMEADAVAISPLPRHLQHKEREMNEAPSLSVLPEGCLSEILSVTSPRDACSAAAVSKRFNSAADSDAVWERFLPPDYREVIARAVSPVLFDSKKQLYLHLSESHILLDNGYLGFKLDKESGKKCYMLGAKDISIAWKEDTRYWEWGRVPGSRFAEAGILREVWWLDIRGMLPTVMLSQKTTYVAYLVFRITENSWGLSVPAKTMVSCGGVRSENSNIYLQQPRSDWDWEQEQEREQARAPDHIMRKDGWMEIELGEFYCDGGDDGVAEMAFHEHVSWKKGLIVEGIELRPK